MPLTATSSRDSDEEIYLIDADGSNPRNLTRHPARDTNPAWHPDGRWIAFVSNREGPSDIYNDRGDAHPPGTSRFALSNARWSSSRVAVGLVHVPEHDRTAVYREPPRE